MLQSPDPVSNRRKRGKYLNCGSPPQKRAAATVISLAVWGGRVGELVCPLLGRRLNAHIEGVASVAKTVQIGVTGTHFLVAQNGDLKPSLWSCLG